MAITSNIGIAVISLAASDNTILNPTAPTVREAVQRIEVTNTTGAAITVDFYESPNLTSGGGDLISTNNSVPANDSIAIVAVEGHGFEVGQNLIAVAGAVGLNLKATITRTDA